MAKSNQNPSNTQSAASNKQKKGPQNAAGSQTASEASSAVELLKQDHRKVEQLFEEFEQADDQEHQQELAHKICKELMVHAMIEEEIFYPACRSGAADDKSESEKLDEAQVEHDSAKILINEILRGEPDDEFWKAKVCVLKDQIQHHVEEEENPGDGVMAKAEENGIDTPELANRLKRRKSELTARADDMRPARAVSLMQPMHHMGQAGMGRGPMGVHPERDERGRAMSEGQYRDYRRGRYGDEDMGRYAGSYSERRGAYGAHEDDDYHRGRFFPYEDENEEPGHRSGYGAETYRRGRQNRR